MHGLYFMAVIFAGTKVSAGNWISIYQYYMYIFIAINKLRNKRNLHITTIEILSNSWYSLNLKEELLTMFCASSGSSLKCSSSWTKSEFWVVEDTVKILGEFFSWSLLMSSFFIFISFTSSSFLNAIYSYMDKLWCANSVTNFMSGVKLKSGKAKYVASNDTDS